MPDFLLHTDDASSRRRTIQSATVSVLVHVLLVFFGASVDVVSGPPRSGSFPDLVSRRVTPLVMPPDLRDALTQRAPQTKEASKEFNVESLVERKEVSKKSPPPQPATSPAPRAGIPAPSLPDGPQIAMPQPQMAQLPPPGTGQTNQAPPPPPEIQTQEKPRISFESVPGTGKGTGNMAGGPSAARINIPVPKSNIDEAVARVAKRPGGGVIVGDDLLPAPSLGESLGKQATPGKLGSALELLSDPQGADFRPYLLRVLTAVRRNWFAVIPESARLGRRGKVIIQFAIDRSGNVPKLVIAIPSGAEPLDRAAVAGISASNPFPPLPNEFKGDQIRLQLSFTYNGQR